jgi:hypothetical protein
VRQIANEAAPAERYSPAVSRNFLRTPIALAVGEKKLPLCQRKEKPTLCGRFSFEKCPARPTNKDTTYRARASKRLLQRIGAVLASCCRNIRTSTPHRLPMSIDAVGLMLFVVFVLGVVREPDARARLPFSAPLAFSTARSGPCDPRTGPAVSGHLRRSWERSPGPRDLSRAPVPGVVDPGSFGVVLGPNPGFSGPIPWIT